MPELKATVKSIAPAEPSFFIDDDGDACISMYTWIPFPITVPLEVLNNVIFVSWRQAVNEGKVSKEEMEEAMRLYDEDVLPTEPVLLGIWSRYLAMHEEGDLPPEVLQNLGEVALRLLGIRHKELMETTFGEAADESKAAEIPTTVDGFLNMHGIDPSADD